MTNTVHTIASLAQHLGVEFKGDGAVKIDSLAPINSAQSGQLSFLENDRYLKALHATKASVIILSEKHLEQCATNAIIAENPHVAFAKVAKLFEGDFELVGGVHPSAVIADNANIDPTAMVSANCVIGNNVTIGANVCLGPNCVIGDGSVVGAGTNIAPQVTLYNDVQLGERCIIHSGVVIGSDGFGYANDNGLWVKVPQLGGVRIGNDVEIGSNTSIDRGALEHTVIEDGVKLDNLIQIAHNVHIGAHTAIAACTGIAGSAKIGRHCMIAGGACIAGHISIADQTIVTATAAVSKSIKEPGGIWSSGIPAHPHRKWRKNVIGMLHIGEIAEKVKKFEKLVNERLGQEEEEDYL